MIFIKVDDVVVLYGKYYTTTTTRDFVPGYRNAGRIEKIETERDRLSHVLCATTAKPGSNTMREYGWLALALSALLI